MMATFLVLLIPFVYPIRAAAADTIQALQSKIADHNAAIKALDEEIANYQKQLDQVGQQKQTLINTISSLQNNRKKLLAELKITENQIAATGLSIESLNIEIDDKQSEIDRSLASLASSVRQIDQAESNSPIENLLTYRHFSEFWTELEAVSQLKESLRQSVLNLEKLKTDLTVKKTDAEGKKKNLVTLRDQLSDKQKVIDYNTVQTNKLLATTKNSEASYKKTLSEKKALKDAFEAELRSIESELKLAIDPNSFPAAGSGILHWPVAKPFVTQKFGMTDFAKANPNVYNGQGHNGIDFRATIGTPILAALEGKVVGAGNTDSVCPGASYGQWVLIEHSNGLSTLYAHLSLIKVSTGEQVATGQTIGYSGETGYATGPHLHFTVYATQGVRVLKRQSKVCGGVYTMPIADLHAYLNPLLYL